MCGHCVKEAALLKISQTACSFFIKHYSNTFRMSRIQMNKCFIQQTTDWHAKRHLWAGKHIRQHIIYKKKQETIGLTKSSVERRSNSHKKTRGQLLMPQGQIDSHKNQIWLRKKTSLADLLILHLYGLLYHDLCPQTFQILKFSGVGYVTVK